MKVSATFKPWRSEGRVCGAPRSQPPLVLTCPDLALTNCLNIGTVISLSLSNGVLWKLACSPSDATAVMRTVASRGSRGRFNPRMNVFKDSAGGSGRMSR